MALYKLGNFTTIMLPFNLASDRRVSSSSRIPEKYGILRVRLYEQYKLVLHKGGHINIYSMIGRHGEFLGQITQSGYFEKSHQIYRLPKGFLELMRQFAATPTKVIRESEIQTGRCCFCNQVKDDKHGQICKWWLDGSPYGPYVSRRRLSEIRVAQQLEQQLEQQKQEFITEALQTDTRKCIIWPYEEFRGYPRYKRIAVTKIICTAKYGESTNKVDCCGNELCINWKHLGWKSPTTHNYLVALPTCLS